MLCKNCIPEDFYKAIRKKENFSYFNDKSVLYPKVLEIVCLLIAENEDNYKKTKRKP